ALVRGDGVVAEPGVVRVDGRELPYDRLVIATGSSPEVPPVFEGSDYWTNREATETSEVPRTLLVIGGGPVGCELAQVFARVGSNVTLVEAGPPPPPHPHAPAAAPPPAAPAGGPGEGRPRGPPPAHHPPPPPPSLLA